MDIQKLILIRGLPGSGKSTLAKKLCTENINYRHIEADMFFITDGVYKFVGSQVRDAHMWCRKQTEKYLNAGCTVVVSNCFVERWEMVLYFKLAEKFNLDCEVIKATGMYGTIHQIPSTTINKMAAKWEEL